jgi:hypothetical protein
MAARISTSDNTPISARLPADLLAALRAHAEENDETVSDALRRGALLVLGICPTCGQKASGTGNESDHGKDDR